MTPRTKRNSKGQFATPAKPAASYSFNRATGKYAKSARRKPRRLPPITLPQLVDVVDESVRRFLPEALKADRFRTNVDAVNVLAGKLVAEAQKDGELPPTDERPADVPAGFCQFGGTQQAITNPAIHCSNCSTVHDLNAITYITFHGKVTVGEERDVTTQTVRLCIGNRECWELVGRTIAEVWAQVAADQPSVARESPFAQVRNTTGKPSGIHMGLGAVAGRV